MERALVSALKVNKAAAWHSASDSWAPPDQCGKIQLWNRGPFNHTHI